MIPHLSLFHRFVAWLIWKFEGYESLRDAEFYAMHHPEMTKVASLMRAYYYVRADEDRERAL